MDIIKLSNNLNIISSPVNVSVYDFNFELFFECSHPLYFNQGDIGILRLGAIDDYESVYNEWYSQGLTLINTPSEHYKASELSEWYPIISDLTPESICVNEFPPYETIEKQFGWPVFIKGSRQTSKHNAELSVAHNNSEYEAIISKYRNDPILHWQKIAIREFIQLQKVPGQVANKVNPSLEFRTFWLHGTCVGWGQYWYQVPKYSSNGIEAGLAIASEAAKRLNVPFIVIDIAMTNSGKWIIIECNDAQESGYASIHAQNLWQSVIEKIHA